MSMNLLRAVSFSLSLFAAAGCQTLTAAKPDTATTGQPAPAASQGISGKVLEVIQSDTYTYISVESHGTPRWAALPRAEIKVGQQVDLRPGMDMHNFTSKSLGRTFDVITFTEAGARPEAKKGEDMLPAVMGMHGRGSIQATDETRSVAGRIVETIPGGEYTYALVDDGRDNTWVAVPVQDLKVGAQTAFLPGTVMRGFTSKTLKKTFDVVVFSEGPVLPKPAATKVAGNDGPVEEFALEGVEGRVVEAVEAGSYTYCAVEKDGKRTWVAVPRMKIEIGQHVRFQPGMIMRDYPSTKLKKKFDILHFSKGIAQ